jgi:hypothetical protein
VDSDSGGGDHSSSLRNRGDRGPCGGAIWVSF